MNIEGDPVRTRAEAIWKQVRPDCRPPLQVTNLKPAHRKSAVYRFIGAGPDGTNVIAKRAKRSTIETERRVHQEVLSILPVSALLLYATADDEDERYGWIFLEDAGDIEWSPDRTECRELAAKWLAQVHLGAAGLVGKIALPWLGVAYYVDLVRAARETVSNGLANDALSACSRELLRQVEGDCVLLQTHWSALESVMSGVPSTLSLPGLSAKNARVRMAKSGPELLAFDFESAFFGPAIIELYHVDTSLYSRTVGKTWAIDGEAIEVLAKLGGVFRAMKSIPGELPTLMSAWPERSIRKLVYCSGRVAVALQALGLSQRARI